MHVYSGGTSIKNLRGKKGEKILKKVGQFLPLCTGIWRGKSIPSQSIPPPPTVVPRGATTVHALVLKQNSGFTQNLTVTFGLESMMTVLYTNWRTEITVYYTIVILLPSIKLKFHFGGRESGWPVCTPPAFLYVHTKNMACFSIQCVSKKRKRNTFCWP